MPRTWSSLRSVAVRGPARRRREALDRGVRGAAGRAGLGTATRRRPPARARVGARSGRPCDRRRRAARRADRGRDRRLAGRPDPAGHMDGAPSAGPFVAEAVAAGAATFQRPSAEIDPALISVLPYSVVTVAGGCRCATAIESWPASGSPDRTPTRVGRSPRRCWREGLHRRVRRDWRPVRRPPRAVARRRGVGVRHLARARRRDQPPRPADHRPRAVHRPPRGARGHARDGEWFRQLRPGTWIPGPVRRICFPEMHLGVDDRAIACGLRPRLLRACGERCAGDQHCSQFASCQNDGPPCWRRSWAAFESLEDCNLGTAKRNPSPRGFDLVNVATIVVRVARTCNALDRGK